MRLRNLKYFIFNIIFLTAACSLENDKIDNSQLPATKSEESLTMEVSGDYDFGTVNVGSSSNITVTLTSVSDNGVAEIILPTLNPPFRIDEDSSTCTDKLEANTSCTLTILFEPFIPQEYEKTLTIRYLNNTHYLNRTYTMKAISEAPTSISLGSTVWNTGIYPRGISDKGRKIRISHNGASQVDGFTLDGLASPLQYNGGNYPGTEGNCYKTITSSCYLNFEITGTSPVFAVNELTVNYTIQDVASSDPVTLYGTSASIFGASDPLVITSYNKGLSNPGWVHSDGSRLFAVDSGSNRVLVYSSAIDASTSPDVVLGQESSSVVAENKGKGTASLSTLSAPSHVYSDGNSLVVSDTGNNRILYWENIPASNSQPATYEFKGLSAPKAAVFTNGKLIAADTGASKIKYWDLSTFTDGDTGIDSGITCDTPVDVAVDGNEIWVVCQGAENSVKKIQDPVTAPSVIRTISNLTRPRSISLHSGQYFISDDSDHIIAVYNGITADNQPKSFFLGTTGNSAASSTTINTAQNLTGFNGKFYVSDYGNHRIVGWNSLTGISTQAADFVIGQTDFTSASEYFTETSDNVYSSPVASIFNDTVLIGDSSQQRLNYYSNVTTSNLTSDAEQTGTSAGSSTAVTVGANSYTYVAEALSSQIHYSATLPDLFTFGTTVASAANVLAICSNDVYLYALLSNNSIERYTHGSPPVLDGTIAHADLNSPASIDCNNEFITVANKGNSEILIWNKASSAPLAAADAPDYSVSVFPSGALSPAEGASTSEDGVLIVADTQNRRILIWNDLTALAADPPFVLGQENLTEFAVTTGSNYFTYPTHVRTHSGKAIITDKGARRAVVIGIPAPVVP